MKYSATVHWQKEANEVFTDNKYGRLHQWKFDGLIVPASASPQVVALPHSNENAIDPEEAFVASLSSCHMLFFLSLAAAKGFTIESYEDATEGILSKNENGKMMMTEVTLHPKIIFSGVVLPTREQVTNLHEEAHARCYIANSVLTKINIIPS
jgi:organic hydroperoxide reductase OsmC/OhrA